MTIRSNVDCTLIVQLITDGWYGSPADMEAKIHSKVAAVYYYVFNYVSDQRIFHPDHIGECVYQAYPYSAEICLDKPF